MGIIMKTENLSFSYDGTGDILNCVNLSLQEGEVVCLLGPNGSGKTTLLKCMNLLLKPTDGRIFCKQQNIIKMKRNELARLIGYVPQEHKPSFPYSVLDVVLLGRSPYIGFFSSPKHSDIEYSQAILNLLGITHLSERPYTTLSGGERKLCLIARALASTPKVLLLDEPVAHLDVKHQRDILKLIHRLSKKEGVAVLMTIHDPNTALFIADRIVLLKEGRIVCEGTSEKIMTKENIESIYECEISFVTDGKMTLFYPTGF